MFSEITENQFSVYVLNTRSKYYNTLSTEIEWYKNEFETIFGLILKDNIDNNYTALILVRNNKFEVRYRSQEIDFKSTEEAKEWLFDQEKVLCKDKAFIRLQEEFLKRIKNGIFKVMPCFIDIDKNFKKEFQYGGFDARIWELYLYCYFCEEGLTIDRTNTVPDYYLKNKDLEVCLEAVTVGRNSDSHNFADKIKTNPSYVLNEIMPIRFGNALRKKVKHTNEKGEHYWEFSHTKGKPFILAIADFCADQSMRWTSLSLPTYLYGYEWGAKSDENGNLASYHRKIKYHNVNGKKIPSGFFFQEGNENVSAVLFSPVGTVGKFNRIGIQCGFGNSHNPMIRQVIYGEAESDCINFQEYNYNVTEEKTEKWAEGVIVYHNPNALRPLPKNFFESAVQSWYDGKELKFSGNGLIIYSSLNICIQYEVNLNKMKNK
jgi:hypothetical protein